MYCFFKDEAFDLWQQQWGRLYPEGSPSRLVIDDICKNYYLVNLVDNDFIKGNCLWEALEKTAHLRDASLQRVSAEAWFTDDGELDITPISWRIQYLCSWFLFTSVTVTCYTVTSIRILSWRHVQNIKWSCGKLESELKVLRSKQDNDPTKRI